MKLTEKLKELLDQSDLNESIIYAFLSELYKDPDYRTKHEEYKNKTITNQESETDNLPSQELANSHKERATILINKLIELSGHDQFSGLLKHFENISPGATRKSACTMLELLEVLTYKFAHNLVSNINYFNSKLYTSTFDACTDGALTSVQTLLQSTNNSLYSAKHDYFKDLALTFAANNIVYAESMEVHVINTLLSFIPKTYNITVPNDIYIKTLEPELARSSKYFKDFMRKNLNSRKCAYEFISCASNINISKLEEYRNTEFKYNLDSPELTTIIDVAKECGLPIPSMLDYEEDMEGGAICKLKPEFEDAIIIGLTAKLINDEIIYRIPLIFTHPSDQKTKHIVLQTPLGWYIVNYDYRNNIYDLYLETAVKLIDARDLYGLTSNRFTMAIEDKIARDLYNKENLTFEEALKSISSDCPIQNPSIADRLFFISDFGNMLSAASSNTEELSSLTSEDVSLWKDILICKNRDDHFKICGEERFDKLIKSECVNRDYITHLIKNTDTSLLHIAVLIENTMLLKLLLGYGYDYNQPLLKPNIIDSNGNTAFHLALLGKNQNIIDIFLSKPHTIDTTVKNKDDKDIMHIAIETRNIEAIELFLQNGYDPNTTDSDGNNLLLYAIKHSSMEIINLLIEHPDINILHKNDDLQNALHLAAAKKGAEDLIKILYQKGCPITDQDSNGEMPLHEAVNYNNLPAIKELLTIDNTAITHYSEGNLTPVMSAAYDDSVEVLEFFLEEKRNNNIDIDIVELLNCAVESDSEITTIKLILDHISIIYINDELIYNSCKHKDANTLIQLFYEKGVNYNIADHDNDTPLHIASYSNYDKAVAALLALPDINPNAQNTDGDTPFHLMTRSGKVIESIVIALLQAGADLSIKNNKDQTPMDILREENPRNTPLLEEIIASHESRKRSINDISISTIEIPIVPEEREPKRQRSSTYVPDEVNTSPVINNIEEVNICEINHTIPNQPNNTPDLGRGL